MVSPVESATKGAGIYTTADAALYSRISKRLLDSWFFGSGSRERAIQPSIESSQRLLSFLDFVQAKSVHILRQRHGIPLQRIRDAVKTAEDVFSVTHPFARKDHKTYVIGKNVYIDLPGGKDSIVGLSGKDRLQENSTLCVEPYMQNIEWDSEGLAARYIVRHFNGGRIVLDPKLNFGLPSIDKHGFTAETLWRAVLAEAGDYGRVAELYEVPEGVVKAASLYFSEDLAEAA